MVGTSMLTSAAVIAATVAFTGWLFGLGALLVVIRQDFDRRHPRLAARLDRTVWVSWIAATAVLFGPALGFGLAALIVPE